MSVAQKHKKAYRQILLFKELAIESFVLLLIFATIFGSWYLIQYQKPKPPNPVISTEQVDCSKSISIAIPKRVVIEKIDIDQEIEIWSNNEIVNPSDWSSIVWWKNGGYPGVYHGKKLTTFLFGHASSSSSKKAVFDRLGLLQPGDGIAIETSSEATFKYKVADVFIVEKNKFPNDHRVAANQQGRLLLVSCWNPEKSGKANYNIVVVAELDGSVMGGGSEKLGE